MTYRYLGRNADNPNQVVTLSLDNDYLHVHLTKSSVKLDEISPSEEKLVESKQHLKIEAVPMWLRFMESYSGPIRVSDVVAYVDGEVLKVGARQCAGGLRVAPLWFNEDGEYNAEAAKAFVAKLEKRKAATS